MPAVPSIDCFHGPTLVRLWRLQDYNTVPDVEPRPLLKGASRLSLNVLENSQGELDAGVAVELRNYIQMLCRFAEAGEGIIRPATRSAIHRATRLIICTYYADEPAPVKWMGYFKHCNDPYFLELHELARQF
jgi:hypothetical protein